MVEIDCEIVMGKLLFNTAALCALVGLAVGLLATRGFTLASLWDRFMPMMSGGPSAVIGAAGVVLVIVLVAVFK